MSTFGPSLPALLVACVTLTLGFGCQTSDVGAPCNHGVIESPTTPTVTFPALACDQLTCLYADNRDPPAEPCESHADCDLGGTGRFRCEAGACTVASTYVLERSMCTQSCESDDDCAGGDPGTACETGFACARIQSLGPFCCEKLCVCRDDLDVAGAAQRDVECAASTLRGCCDQDPVPNACGA